MRKHEHKKEINLQLDSRNRICLTQFLSKDLEISSFKAYMEGENIVLEPLAEIPIRELWLYKNPKALASVLKGIDQSEKGQIKKIKRNFSKYLNNEI
jgi:hypothetical protein